MAVHVCSLSWMQMLWPGSRLGGCEEESGTQDGSALSSSWAAAVAADAADVTSRSITLKTINGNIVIDECLRNMSHLLYTDAAR